MTTTINDNVIYDGIWVLDLFGNPLERKCSDCQQFKGVGEFHTSKSHKHGIRNQCKPCMNASATLQKKKGRIITSAIQLKTGIETAKDAAILFGMSDPNTIANFMKHLPDEDERTLDNCWEWKGHLTMHGYGQFGIYADGQYLSPVKAHRFAYAWHYKVLPPSSVMVTPDSLTLDHECENRRCVNPLHLNVVTHSENLQLRHSERDVRVW